MDTGRSRSATTTSERPSSKWAAGSAATRSVADPSTRIRSAPCATTPDFALADLAGDAEDRVWTRLGGTEERTAEVRAEESCRAILVDAMTVAAGG